MSLKKEEDKQSLGAKTGRVDKSFPARSENSWLSMVMLFARDRSSHVIGIIVVVCWWRVRNGCFPPIR